MNAPLDLKMDKATFLRWVEAQERRYELVGGEIVMQQANTLAHADIAARFMRAFFQRLDDGDWLVTGGDFAVEIGADIRLPDAMVQRLPVVAGSHTRRGEIITTTSPALILEVLSPSSVRTDLAVKVPLYQSIASLEALIVAAQDEPRIWLWVRDDGKPGRPFPSEPVELDRLDACIDIPHMGLKIPLAEVYRDF